MKLGTTLILGWMLLGCQPDDPSASLQDRWIEDRDRMDTITFIEDNRFILHRGFEVRNGHRLPRHGSGIYEYTRTASEISLYNTLSSCYCFNDYRFEQQGDHFTIGDFYQKDTVETRVLRFTRLE